MPTLVFVHGTGVRQPRYAETLAAVTRIVSEVRPATQVRGCFWGEKHGARLALGGASIPDSGRHRGPDPTDDVQTWALLVVDPLFELRSPTIFSGRRGVEPPLLRSRAEELGARLAAATHDPLISELAASASLTATLPRAIVAVTTDPDTVDALDAPEAGEAAPWLLCRAVVAAAIRDLVEPGTDPQALNGAARDELVAALTAYLQPAADFRAVPQIVTTATEASARAAWRLFGARAVERRRALIMDSTHPLTGDVLVYLSHGESIRAAIAEHVDAAEPPVTLLGHSLGGVACFDMLVAGANPKVTKLVTIGSQAPLLYELGALSSLVYPSPLPPSVPSWTNIYDPRDLLAFVAAPVFGGEVGGVRVEDVRVEGKQPFPFSHSGYWSLEGVREALRAALPPDGNAPAEV